MHDCCLMSFNTWEDCLCLTWTEFFFQRSPSWQLLSRRAQGDCCPEKDKEATYLLVREWLLAACWAQRSLCGSAVPHPYIYFSLIFMFTGVLIVLLCVACPTNSHGGQPFSLLGIALFFPHVDLTWDDTDLYSKGKSWNLLFFVKLQVQCGHQELQPFKTCKP